MTTDSAKYSHAELPLASDFLHRLLNLPDDVHIIGVMWECMFNQDLGNVVLALEAFSDGEFPSQRVTARFNEEYEPVDRRPRTVFDGWESID